ncbi:Protein of unknown function [Marinobacter sp. es.042]|uniref:DUF4435 domain-containing protein n=1 Tax=Marinobacter sp. es.042 TaxID=1761794 RepID=UPI000B50A1EB|nr:DUF4435 domain-containing protein [Marinobacter sp. es.042]SNB54142.1 Protein of unknown function [Marinobacter sp. es.042]
MSSRAENMREKRSATAVGLARLIKAHSKAEDVLICVFEGEDAKYYGIRVDSIVSPEYRTNISCKGKENLLKLREKVSSNPNLSSAKVLYFIDRDFDFDDVGDEFTYVTPCYSIENLYVSVESLRKFLVDEIGMCEIDNSEDVDFIVDKFLFLKSQFLNKTKELNAWILCQVRESYIDDSVKLNLNNYDIKKFVNISLDSVVSNYNMDKLVELFPDSAEVKVDSVESAKVEIEARGGQEYVRGKYYLEFFREYLGLICNEIQGDSQIVSYKKKVRVNLSKSNVLSDLSQYADTPVCLVDFLRNAADRFGYA